MAIYTGLLNEVAVGSTSNSNYNLFQFSIDLERADLAMFESLVQLDMVEVCNEKGLISITEEEQKAADNVAKEGIISKIKALFDKFIAAASNFINTVSMKLNELLKIDKKLVDKFKPVFTIPNIKKCTLTGVKVINYAQVVANTTMPNSAKFEWSKAVAVFKNNAAKTTEAIKAEQESVDKLLVGGAFKESWFKDAIVTIEGPVKDASDADIMSIFKSLEDISTNKDIIDSIKEIKKEISEMKKTSNDQLKSFKDDKNITKELIKAKYDYNRSFISKFTSFEKTIISCHFANYKMSRACVVKVGNWILNNVSDDKKETKEEPKNEAYYYALGEMSNMYVDEALSLV